MPSPACRWNIAIHIERGRRRRTLTSPAAEVDHGGTDLDLPDLPSPSVEPDSRRPTSKHRKTRGFLKKIKISKSCLL